MSHPYPSNLEISYFFKIEGWSPYIILILQNLSYHTQCLSNPLGKQRRFSAQKASISFFISLSYFVEYCYIVSFFVEHKKRRHPTYVECPTKMLLLNFSMHCISWTIISIFLLPSSLISNLF